MTRLTPDQLQKIRAKAKLAVGKARAVKIENRAEAPKIRAMGSRGPCILRGSAAFVLDGHLIPLDAKVSKRPRRRRTPSITSL